MTRLTELTPSQHAAMGPFAQEWIKQALRTEPLSDDEWAEWEAGARECYRFAGVQWPDRIVRVPNPLVGALAAPIADHLLRGAVGGAVRGAVTGAVHDAVRDAVDVAVDGAVDDAVDVAVGGAVDGAVDVAVDVAVDGAVDVAVDVAVDGAVDVAVHGAVTGAVHGAVDGAVDVAVHVAVGGAVGGAVTGAVHDAVTGAVDGAVGDAVRRRWHLRIGGRHWPYWAARAAFYRDIVGLQLDDDIWERSRAYEAANTAGWWWPNRHFVMVSDLPRAIHLERVGEDGWGSHRLHNETGPAIEWDGYALHFWHGTRVPASLIEDGWDVATILKEPNAEIRRCAIERIGWDVFIADAGLERVGEAAPDPGNPGHVLELFDIPESIYDVVVRVLLCTNATVERDGTRRRFGLTVPQTIDDPVGAAAWTFQLETDEYANLQRAS